MTTKGNRIHLLSDQVMNKIAAGEVVDRPASVLKELMENALDAGATQIDAEVVAGGRKAITVSDNGSGMSRDDALLSIERHATSKIRDVDDIERVGTLGFRGEALAAISAVSRFALLTRRADDEVGTEILMSGGKIQEVRDAGGPAGTSVRVRQLFFNVPARRKFLRTEQTESAHVRQTFMVYALAHPEVGMSLSIDGRPTYRLNAGADRRERIREVYGNDVVRGIRPVAYELQNLSISGFIGLPHLTRSDRSDQFIFINNRPATAPLLSYALAEGYQTLVPRGRYPLVFLFLTIDPAMVDVNVHPMKQEVRFRQPIMVRDALIESVREALAEPATQEETDLSAAPAPRAPVSEPVLQIEDLPAREAFSYPRIPMAPSEAGPAKTPASPDEGESVETAAPPWARCRVLGQVGGLYVVLETDEGLVLMDPHAAHERILYERLMQQALAGEVQGQGLLVPETVDLPPKDALMVRKNMDLLRQMGFGVSDFGGDSFMVDALPTCLGNTSAQSILADVAGSLERGGARGGAERWSKESVAQAACKAAVKARDKLTVKEVEQLVIDLARAEMPYTCPHGRPTVIFMSFGELDRKFGRT